MKKGERKTKEKSGKQMEIGWQRREKKIKKMKKGEEEKKWETTVKRGI